MANGPRYRVPFRRRREGKTNYHRRMRLIRSRRNRVVIRTSNLHTTVQVFDAEIKGDIKLAQAHTSQLSKEFGWNYNTGNLPSAYLAGYLCGLRAKAAKIEDAILDVGILVHDNRVKAAFRGFVDSGVPVPHDESWFGEGFEDRIKGVHIQDYANLLSKEDKKRYSIQFSANLKKSADPTKIVKEFEKVKAEIESKVK